MPIGTEVCLGLGHIVLDGDQARPEKGQSRQFSARVYCGKTAGWIKTPLGREVGLGPVQMGPDPPLPKGHAQSPNFRPMPVVVKRLDRSRCHLVGR